MPLAITPSVKDVSDPADIITCALESGMPASLDRLASNTRPEHRFLRRAWYLGSAHTNTCTFMARRRDGTPVIAIPTRPVGPMVMRARSVTGSYWPFRSFPVAQDATDPEIAALLQCPVVQRALGPVLRVGPVYEDDASLVQFRRVAQSLGWQVLERNLGYSFIQHLHGPAGSGQPAEPWPSKSRLRKLRACERKLEAAHGPLSIRFIRGAEWNSAAFDDLAAIERSSWVGTSTDHSGAKFINPAQLAHWITVVADRELADMLCATILYAGGAPVAFSLDLSVAPVQYGIASSYSEALARFSPGQIVNIRQIQNGMTRGITTIDWGQGDSGYKREIGAQCGPQVQDLLFVRGETLAKALRPAWEMTNQNVSKVLAAGLAGSINAIGITGAIRLDRLIMPGLAIAAAAIAISE